MTDTILPQIKGYLTMQRNANIEQTSEINKDYLCYFTASEANIRCLPQIC